MEIVNNKVLILNLKRPERVTAVIPKSKTLGEDNGLHKVAVNWGLEEAQVLKNLGIKNIPSSLRFFGTVQTIPTSNYYRIFSHATPPCILF